VSVVNCTRWVVPGPRRGLAGARQLGIRETERKIKAEGLSHRASRQDGTGMVEFGSVLDVVIRGAVKAVETSASVGTPDMLLWAS